MRYRSKLIGTLVIAILFCNGLLSQSLSANAALSSNEILIGDEVILTLSISANSGVKITSIGVGVLDKIEKVEVKSIPAVDTATQKPVLNLSQQIILTSFDSGVYKLPPIPISYLENGQEQTVSTQTLQLIVSTIPVELSDSTDIQPIKEIIKEKVGIEEVYPYLLVALGLGLIIALVLYYLKRKNSTITPAEPSAPPLKAHELAIQKLALLKASNLLAEKAFKKYQSELTYILREYLENRYQVAALESTTGEILSDLLKVDFPQEWHQRLKAMLQKVDLIKFAKADFPLSFHEDAVQSVEAFIIESKEEEIAEESETSAEENPEDSTN